MRPLVVVAAHVLVAGGLVILFLIGWLRAIGETAR